MYNDPYKPCNNCKIVYDLRIYVLLSVQHTGATQQKQSMSWKAHSNHYGIGSRNKVVLINQQKVEIVEILIEKLEIEISKERVELIMHVATTPSFHWGMHTTNYYWSL